MASIARQIIKRKRAACAPCGYRVSVIAGGSKNPLACNLTLGKACEKNGGSVDHGKEKKRRKKVKGIRVLDQLNS